MLEGREDEEGSLVPAHQLGAGWGREEEMKSYLQLAGLEAGARLVLCKDMEMSYWNWMERER